MDYGVQLTEGDINTALYAILGSVTFLFMIAAVFVWMLASQLWDTLFETLNVLIGGRVAGGRGVGSFGGTAGVSQIHLPGGGGGFHGNIHVPSGGGAPKFSLKGQNSGLGGSGSSSFSGQIRSVKSGAGGENLSPHDRLMAQGGSVRHPERLSTASRRGGVNHE